jgi:hypothetical protein
MVDLAHRARLIRERFLNRVDIVAVQVPGGRPGPALVDDAAHLDALIAAHLDATAPPVAVRFRPPTPGAPSPGSASARFRLGSYNLALDNTTRWLLLDFDGPGHKGAYLADPLAAAGATMDAFTARGLATHLERSGGGQGFHLWMFLETPIAASMARKIGFALAQPAQLNDGSPANAKAGRGIEVFPKQDVLSGEGVGNLVFLPWWHGAADGGNVFCVRDGMPYEPDSLALVSAETAVREFASLCPPRVETPRAHVPPHPGRSGSGTARGDFEQRNPAVKDAVAADPHRLAEALGCAPFGRRYLCPVCQVVSAPPRAALSVNGGFYCNKCNLDEIGIVQSVKALRYPEALAWLERLYGLDVAGTPSSGSQVRSRPAPAPRTPSVSPDLYEAFCDACRDLPDPVPAWLESKAISRDVAVWAGLRFIGRELPDVLEDLRARFGADAVKAAGFEVLTTVYSAKQIGVVVFPYRHHGRIVHVKCRPPFGKTEAERLGVLRFVACGSCPVPYNVDLLELYPGADVMICEGETDTLAALTAGMVAIGSPGKSGFKRAWVPLLRGHRVVVYYDADAAGREGADSLKKLLERAGQPPPVSWKSLPEGMDLSDFLARAAPAQDAEALREDFEERAAIMEYDGGLSRADAEREARARVYGRGGRS